MTTLGTLKAEIATDTYRDDLTASIASKITSAIRFYNRHRFYWNTLDSSTFDMVVDQTRYGVSDATFIPNIVRIDALFLGLDDSKPELTRKTPAEIETLLGSNPSSGEPECFTYENQTLRFYPPPDDTYEITVHGVISVTEPSSDAETDNPWMLEGYDLIRLRAMSKLYGETLQDPNTAAKFERDETIELNTIVGETNMRSGTGELVPTEF